MLGLGPIAARPIAAVIVEPLRRILASAAPFGLSAKTVAIAAARRVSAAVATLTASGLAVAFTRSFSQAAFKNINLVGSTSTKNYGFDMIQNFTMTAGDSKTLVVTVKNATGDRVSITGATIKWKASRSHRKTAVISKQTGNSGISITDGANGEFAVTLSPSDTDSLYGDYYHEAELTASDGTISTVLNGTMKVNRALITA